MANVELFNSLGGFSVGIPPKPVLDSTGNLVTNVNAPNANLTANRVYSNYYYYANGLPLGALPGGSNTQLQYNANGVLGGIANVTWNGNILSLGEVTALSIGGGVNGYFLQTDGTGNLTWAAGGGGGGNGSPGGANTQVQFNDAGTFGGDPGFTYNNITNTLHVDNIDAGEAGLGNITTTSNIVANGNVTASFFIGDGSQLSNISVDVANTVRNNAQPNITSVGNLVSLTLEGALTSNADIETTADVITGNLSVSRDILASSASFTHSVSVSGNLTVNTGGNLKSTGNVNFAGSPNINLGTLSNIHIAGGLNGYVLSTDGAGGLSWVAGGGGGGNGSPGGNLYSIQYNDNGDFGGAANFTYNPFSSILTVDNIETTKVTLSGNLTVNASGNLKVVGNILANNSPSINLGSISNVHIQGGTNGYALITDGLGNLSWAAQGGGNGGGVPGGSNTQIQYNSSGTFAASPYFTFNDATNTVNIGGDLIANTFTIGAGVYKYSTASVYAATTNSTSPNQVILSLPVTNLAGADYVIISTDALGGIRNYVKISAVIYASTVNYTETFTLAVGGYIGDYQVVYNAGNIISDPSMDLILTPQSANLMTHKMMITKYSE